MLRVGLFLLTNLAILVVISITFNVLGLSGVIAQGGINFPSLLVMAAIFGMGGSIISLLMSKSLARRSTGARIIQQPYFRFEVHQSADIREVAEQIKAFMETQGFDFLEKYSTISELDKLFNDKPREKLPYAYNHLNRCLRGIVLARMADRKDFPAIAATYRNTLLKSSTAPPLLEKYDKLVNHLKTFSFN